MSSMKVAVHCHSKLLQKSLEKFLSTMIVSIETADIIVSDRPIQSEKPILYIGTNEDADLKKPFSRSQLMIKLEEKLAQNSTQTAMEAMVDEEEPSLGLEEKIAEIMKRYTQEVIETVKEYYETKS